MTHGRFPPTQLLKFPRMRPEDVAVWRQFIDSYGTMFEGFDYDYPVGPGRSNPFTPGSEKSRLYSGLTQYRVDAIGYRPTSTWVIEIKEVATPEALGQALVYATLYRDSTDGALLVVPVVVAGSCRQDTRSAYKAAGVELVCISPIEPQSMTSDISGA